MYVLLRALKSLWHKQVETSSIHVWCLYILHCEHFLYIERYQYCLRFPFFKSCSYFSNIFKITDYFDYLCLKYLINSFFVFRFCYLTKNKKISCPIYLLFTEKEAAVSAQLAVSVLYVEKFQNKDYVIFGDL